MPPESAGNGSLNNEEIDKEIFKCVDLENIDTNSPCFKSILVISLSGSNQNNKGALTLIPLLIDLI